MLFQSSVSETEENLKWMGGGGNSPPKTFSLLSPEFQCLILQEKDGEKGGGGGETPPTQGA